MVTASLIYNVKMDFDAKIFSFLGTISFLPQITGDVNRTTIITGLEIENDQYTRNELNHSKDLVWKEHYG